MSTRFEEYQADYRASVAKQTAQLRTAAKAAGVLRRGKTDAITILQGDYARATEERNARIREMETQYATDTQNVLNTDALELLATHANINTPTLTSIHAGYEFARAAEARRERDAIDAEKEDIAREQAIDLSQTNNTISTVENLANSDLLSINAETAITNITETAEQKLLAEQQTEDLRVEAATAADTNAKFLATLGAGPSNATPAPTTQPFVAATPLSDADSALMQDIASGLYQNKTIASGYTPVMPGVTVSSVLANSAYAEGAIGSLALTRKTVSNALSDGVISPDDDFSAEDVQTRVFMSAMKRSPDAARQSLRADDPLGGVFGVLGVGVVGDYTLKVHGDSTPPKPDKTTSPANNDSAQVEHITGVVTDDLPTWADPPDDLPTWADPTDTASVIDRSGLSHSATSVISGREIYTQITALGAQDNSQPSTVDGLPVSPDAALDDKPVQELIDAILAANITPEVQALYTEAAAKGLVVVPSEDLRTPTFMPIEEADDLLSSLNKSTTNQEDK